MIVSLTLRKKDKHVNSLPSAKRQALLQQYKPSVKNHAKYSNTHEEAQFLDDLQQGLHSEFAEEDFILGNESNFHDKHDDFDF